MFKILVVVVVFLTLILMVYDYVDVRSTALATAGTFAFV